MRSNVITNIERMRIAVADVLTAGGRVLSATATHEEARVQVDPEHFCELFPGVEGRQEKTHLHYRAERDGVVYVAVLLTVSVEEYLATVAA